MSEVSDDLSRFSLARFLEADPESGDAAAGALKHALEGELHSHLVSDPAGARPGAAGAGPARGVEGAAGPVKRAWREADGEISGSTF